jgi:FMN phosphatase YigB (HAD superfamily)
VTRPFDVITFDCYGTLIDWEAGITEAFREASAVDGVSPDPAAALRALFEKEPEAQAAEYRSYRELLTDTAVRVGERVPRQYWQD